MMRHQSTPSPDEQAHVAAQSGAKTCITYSGPNILGVVQSFLERILYARL